jgi:hypothetical protein
MQHVHIWQLFSFNLTYRHLSRHPVLPLHEFCDMTSNVRTCKSYLPFPIWTYVISEVSLARYKIQNLKCTTKLYEIWGFHGSERIWPWSSGCIAKYRFLEQIKIWTWHHSVPQKVYQCFSGTSTLSLEMVVTTYETIQCHNPNTTNLCTVKLLQICRHMHTQHYKIIKFSYSKILGEKQCFFPSSSVTNRCPSTEDLQTDRDVLWRNLR